MKKVILAALVLAGASFGALAQGTLECDNQNNTNSAVGAVTGGFVFQNGSLATGQWNVTLLAGSSSANVAPIATLLYSAGQVLSGADIGAPGQWIDLTGSDYVVPGVAAQGTAFVQVEFWTGSYASYSAALQGTGYVGITPVFTSATGGNGFPGTDMLSMPAVTLVPVPEPATLALAGLGAASLLLFRRRK